MTDSARWKATVYVGGLASLATTTNLHDAFIPFGEIADISLPKNDAANATEPHRGFAYVEYEDPEDAKEAIDNMDQSEFFGRVLKVSPAKPPKSADEGLGSKTAVWEQVRPRVCLRSFIQRDAYKINRRDGLPNTLSVRRIASRLLGPIK